MGALIEMMKQLDWSPLLIPMKTAVAATVIAFPLMYRNARAAFELVDPDLIYAARTLGMSATAACRRGMYLPVPGLRASWRPRRQAI